MDDQTAVAERRALFERMLSGVAAGEVPPEPQYGLVGEPLRAALLPLAEAPDLDVAALRILGDRVDITARTHNREWAIVLGVPVAEPLRVNFAAVFERPPAFEGVDGGFVVVLRGVTGAGKTSLMAAFCERAPTPWLRFDDHMVGELPLRFLIWPDATGPLRAGFLAALPVIARQGNQIITVAHSNVQPDYVSALVDVPHLFVRLECAADELAARALARGDRRAGLVEEGLAQADAWHYDLRIDTGRSSPEEAALLLLRAVQQRQGAAAAPGAP